MSGQVVFVTARLQAERFGPADADVFYAVYRDPEAMRYVGDGQSITREACDRWITVTLENYQRRNYGMFKLLRREDGELVGCCGLVHPGNQVAPETKYCLLPEHWGRGYATEALRGLLDYAAGTHGITDLIATVDPAHTASHHVLEKCGFTKGRTVIEDDGLPTLIYYRGHESVQDGR